MTEALNRDELIQLLGQLGSEDDEEALGAARAASARLAAAGLGWDDLLVPEWAAAEDDAPEPAADESEAGADQPAPPSGAGDGDEESLALIDGLLARKDISQELRDELEGYRADIAEGEFLEADRRYLRAMHQRLSK